MIYDEPGRLTYSSLQQIKCLEKSGTLLFGLYNPGTSHMCRELKGSTAQLSPSASLFYGLWFRVGIPIPVPASAHRFTFRTLRQPTSVAGVYTVSVFSSLGFYMVPTLPPLRLATLCCWKRVYNFGVEAKEETNSFPDRSSPIISSR